MTGKRSLHAVPQVGTMCWGAAVLDAISMLAATGAVKHARLEVGDREVRITNADRVYVPATGATLVELSGESVVTTRIRTVRLLGTWLHEQLTEEDDIMGRRTITTGLAAAAGLLPLALATPAYSAEDATVSVLHAVPGVTVDVYANGEELIPGFEPGTLTDPLTLPAGTYDLAVFPAGEGPDGDPAIEADGVEVPAGANATVVAHLDAEGDPTLSLFANDTSSVPAGKARLTVRHVAAAPAVDVRAAGQPVFKGLENPDEDLTEVAAGTVSADVVLAGTSDVAIGPADLDLAEGTNTIVYAWGSAADDNLAVATQTIEGLHSAPKGVPAGSAGLASEDASLPTWLVVGTALGLLGAAGATGRLVRVRARG